MIQSNQLRVGNYLQRIGKHENYLHKVDAYDIGVCQYENEWFNKKYTPIPLTEEWSLNLGANMSDSNYEFKNIGYNISKQEVYLINKYGICSLINTLKYVHQLQNIYFALKNSELAVNEQLHRKINKK